jgi:ABC-type molybdate transport system substrate-binding protein
VLATGLSPTLNTPCLKTLTIRQYATGVLDLMACRAGGLSVPITASCLPPVTDASDTASQFRSNATATTTSTVPLTAPTFTMAQLGAELAAATTAGACSGGANALLAIENPATSPFGIAAEAALLAPIASGGANLGSLAPYLLPAGNGCIVFGGFGPGQATAQQILRGTPVAGVAAAQHAKYALLSQAATMDPTATETNWTLKVPVSAYSSSAAGVIPMYMAILSPPISANPNYEAQARRFMNYMLSPLGQAVLAEYGFGPITPQATDITGTGGTVLPVPENSTL